MGGKNEMAAGRLGESTSSNCDEARIRSVAGSACIKRAICACSPPSEPPLFRQSQDRQCGVHRLFPHPILEPFVVGAGIDHADSRLHARAPQEAARRGPEVVVVGAVPAEQHEAQLGLVPRTARGDEPEQRQAELQIPRSLPPPDVDARLGRRGCVAAAREEQHVEVELAQRVEQRAEARLVPPETGPVHEHGVGLEPCEPVVAADVLDRVVGVVRRQTPVEDADAFFSAAGSS